MRAVLTGKPNVYGSIFQVRGPGERVLGGKGSVLSLPLSRTAAAGLVPVLCRGRRARRFAGNRRDYPGERGDSRSFSAPKEFCSIACCFSMRGQMKFRQLKLRKNPNCPICGENATIKELIDYEAFCGLNVPEAKSRAFEEITATELNRCIDRTGRSADDRCSRAARI